MSMAASGAEPVPARRLGMLFWRQPTLLRRLVLAVVLALAVIWLALVAFEYLKETRQDNIRSGMSSFMRYEMAAFEEIHTAPEAYQFAVSLEREFNRSRREDGRPDALMELILRRGDQAGKRPLWMTPEPMPGRVGEVVAWHHEGRDYLVFRGDTPLWTFQLAYPLLSFGDVTTWVGSILGLRLLIAFPLILLPLWLAISRGLHPLRRLSAQVALRHADDLSPVGFVVRHAELQPLVDAIDRLLALLRARLAREQAFVQDAAHELRTPMAVISAHVHVLAQARSPAERAEAEQHVNQAIARASHLTQQLLDLARLEGAPTAAAHAEDLAALTRQAVAEAAPAAVARGIDLALDAPAQLMHPAERQVYLSVISNLLDNALRYVQPGGWVRVQVAAQAEDVVLSVSDNGPGIPHAERELVFERFRRGRLSGSLQDVSGSGLGLAIVRQAAQRLGGRLQLTTGPAGQGCCFELRLPQRATAHPPNPSPPAAPPAATRPA